ncbi:hypothetical protein GGR50DRAFT_665108 [Xylaria sp. CBS 124048]|nr:hypothetical protein GGR50DRAFT_665108 [Xylaria sp. CBS 124048]
MNGNHFMAPRIFLLTQLSWYRETSIARPERDAAVPTAHLEWNPVYNPHTKRDSVTTRAEWVPIYNAPSERPERRERPEPFQHPDRVERLEHLERFEDPGRFERFENPERFDHPDRLERHEHLGHYERLERPEHHERLERLETADRLDRPDRPERDSVINVVPERDPVNNARPKLEPARNARAERNSDAQELLTNTGTLDVLISPGGCTLTADECQFAHLKRLRRQYARPFELFCEEMDSISDNCLTGLCLAMPDMPWSVIMSRLAFLFKSTVDGGGGVAPSDLPYLSTGTTIGCRLHFRYIQLRELMIIQDWRDYMRWAHNQSHIFNLCGQPSCIKLKHMCLEPIDCMTSRNRCRTNFHSVYGAGRSIDQANRSVPSACSSPGCWPPCLLRNQFTNILHSATVEFAALHQVSFGPITSVMRGHLYTPVNGRRLGKLVQNDKYQVVFPFHKSYGHIVVGKWEANGFVEVDTLLSIPPLYTLEEVQPVLDKLAARPKITINETLNSLFWYARRRNAPFITKDSGGGGSGQVAHFDRRSPRYQCPFCHGFDNYDEPTASGTVPDFNDLVEALHHMLRSHKLVPLTRKIKFIYEETYECPTIRDAWRLILQGDYEPVVASLRNGELPRALSDLCDRPFGHHGREVLASENHVTAAEVKIEQVMY